MQRLLTRLNAPYPFSSRFRESISTILFVSAFVVLWYVLAGSEEATVGARIGYAFLYGLATLLTASLNVLLQSRLVSPAWEQNWKVKYELLFYAWQFLSIAVVIYLLAMLLHASGFRFAELLMSVASTVLIGGIPLSIHVLREQNKLLRQHLEEASQMSRFAERPTAELATPNAERQQTITIANQEIQLADILYVESDKNYLNLHLQDQPVLRTRSTLKQFAAQVADYPTLMRCHRAFFVNLDHLQSVSGNAQGLNLSLYHSEQTIPVSRAYIPAIRAQI